MRLFKKSQAHDIQFLATQYGVDEEANKLVRLCSKSDFDNKVYEVPGDLLGKPKNAFKAVNNNEGWQPINEYDWIVKKGEELFVVPNNIFKLFFEEVKESS